MFCMDLVENNCLDLKSSLKLFKTSQESQKAALRTSHQLLRCEVYFLKDVTITIVTTATVSTVSITTMTI